MRTFTYCNNLISYSRFKTRSVDIGGVPLGGDYPIRVQSMTSTPTHDIMRTVEQSVRMIEAGCEYVRIATPGLRDVENLKNIKTELRRRGYSIPIIADVHFNPKVAEAAAAVAEKVRINPGNYADRNHDNKADYSEKEYRTELERIKERVKPLIEICKAHGTALRIGSNHGSLSERIKNRYGDTPPGMVESAMEFIRICEELDFHKLIISMKSSNTKITVFATRLLVSRMMEEGMDYPVHLGVTEAGVGVDGRIKSAAGIGALLADGIGDTIRVSLTEEPEKELPVAKALVHYYQKQSLTRQNIDIEPFYNPFEYHRRETAEVSGIGGSNPPVVITDANELTFPNLQVDVNTFCDLIDKDLEKFISEPKILILEETGGFNLFDFRKAFSILKKNSIKVPVIIKINYKDLSNEELLLHSSADIASLHIDGFGDGIWLTADESISRETLKETPYSILQAIGTRISKTEYISCPSCSRTSYDIQSAVHTIREKTSHLKGLKIAIMGCIVNGPGEMADAHYGYVGSGSNKVNLYKGRECVRRNVDSEVAVNALIDLIKKEGDWVEP